MPPLSPDPTDPLPPSGIPRRGLPEWLIKYRYVVVAAIVVGAGLVFVPREFCFSDCFTIKAGAVSLRDPEKAFGQFTLVGPTGFGSGISTDRLGGGCVVFRSPTNETCEQNKCTLPGGLGPQPYAYCSPAKTCWIKISENHCWKSAPKPPPPPPTKLVPNIPKETPEVDLLDVRNKLFGFGGPDKIKARVIACLNGKFTQAPPPCVADKSDPPPAKTNSIEDYGAIYELALPRGAPRLPPLCPPSGKKQPAGC